MTNILEAEKMISEFTNINFTFSSSSAPLASGPLASSFNKTLKNKRFIHSCKSSKKNEETASFFYKWMSTAQKHSAGAFSSYKNCPIAGRAKYLLFIAGCVWGLARGLAGQYKERRRMSIQNAFFKACANYWCVRRCIVRWKYRKMKERSSLEIISTSEPMSTVPKAMWYSIIDNNEKYTFYIRDLIRLIHERLTNSEFFIIEPLRPINPLTGAELSDNQIHCIVMRCLAVNVGIPWSLISFWKLKFNLSEYISHNYVCLHEISIKNEAFSMNQELTDDIEAMYDSFNLECMRPCFQDAVRLNLVHTLIKTHQTPLHSFFLSQRSLCKYTQALAMRNVQDQCKAASLEYHKITQATLFRDCLNNIQIPFFSNNNSVLNSEIRINIHNANSLIDSQTQSLPEAYDTEEEVDSP